MARSKQYNEDVVIEKAMNLFWCNGYKTTSIRMLEKEMGINQFSIYSSFGSKQGVFLECIKTYKNRLDNIRNVLKFSGNGTIGIKQFFYDILKFTKEDNTPKGCLVCNTFSEFGENINPNIQVELDSFTEEIRLLFENNLKQETYKTEEIIQKEVNFLIASILGLSLGSRILQQDQLEDYIEMTFKNI